MSEQPSGFKITTANVEELWDAVDNGTTHVTIATPEGWKCDRPGCRFDWLHKHTTYPSLMK